MFQLADRCTPCTELIVRVMCRWSNLFLPTKKNESLGKVVQLFHPRIINDIFSGIMLMKYAALGDSLRWKVDTNNIPGLMNYMKVINATKKSAVASEGPGTSVKKVLFHKDWNHIADILLHQYELYLFILTSFAKDKNTKFFSSVMYPDLIGPTRYSRNEKDLLAESLSNSSVLTPKSHHWFIRGNDRVNIPLTFSACMEAYVNGGENLCPHWSMEKVPDDIFYNLDDFILDIRLFRQPPKTFLCGVCAVNNVTQSDLVISKATKDSKKKHPPPTCLTALAKSSKCNVEGFNVVDDDEISQVDESWLLHDHDKGTDFQFFEMICNHLRLTIDCSKRIKFDSKDTFVSSVSAMEINDGWILELSDQQSQIAHNIALRRLSSSLVLLLDSEKPTPQVFDHESCYLYLFEECTQIYSLLLKNLPPLPWFVQDNDKSSQQFSNNVKVLVSHEYLTLAEVSLRMKSTVKGNNDSKNSDGDGDKVDTLDTSLTQHGANKESNSPEVDKPVAAEVEAVLVEVEGRASFKIHAHKVQKVSVATLTQAI